MKNLLDHIKALAGSPALPLVSILLIIILGGFVSRETSVTEVEELNIQIHNLHENHFVVEQDILEILSYKNQILVGEAVGELPFKEIEADLAENPYISQAEVFGNFTGVVNLEVWLRRPLVRVIREDGGSIYVSQEGVVLPTSEDYSSRVILLTGKGTEPMHADSFWTEGYGEELLGMIHFINDDPFWKAQVSQIEVEEDGDLILIPQVTKQKILFGRPEDYEKNFKKLMVFYDRILPQKGWNYYTEVNLKFKDQIICY